eukprot:TRINITY_DN56074_c0_g1_i1.p1 TRINITY_DN56074_c0_g1~~TRINITY_DN56074_c0_g1_i1.p1  ORF type:complete len:466 (+),score=135.72 TRINITY_DN56074_c0_g1_i1:100-1398(+)
MATHQQVSECARIKFILQHTMRWEHPLLSTVLWTPDERGPAGAGEPRYSRGERITHLFMDFMLSMAITFVMGFAFTTDSFEGVVSIWFATSALYWVAHMVLVYPVAYILALYDPSNMRSCACCGKFCEVVLILYGVLFIVACAVICFSVTAVYGCTSWSGCSTTLYLQWAQAPFDSCEPPACDSFNSSMSIFRQDFAEQQKDRWGIDFGWSCSLIYPPMERYTSVVNGAMQLTPTQVPMPCNSGVTVCGVGNADPLREGWGEPQSCELNATALCRCFTEYRSVGRMVFNTMISYCIISWWITIPLMHLIIHYLSGKICCGHGTPLYEYACGVHSAVLGPRPQGNAALASEMPQPPQGGAPLAAGGQQAHGAGTPAPPDPTPGPPTAPAPVASDPASWGPGPPGPPPPAATAPPGPPGPSYGGYAGGADDPEL